MTKQYEEKCHISGHNVEVCPCDQCCPEAYDNELPDTVEQLIANLQYLEVAGLNIPTTEDEYGAGALLQHDHEVVQTISGIACSVLIGDGGQCDWDNIRKVKDAGYHVYAGERDSFGWLSGCIRTKVGVVVYG